MDWEEALRDLSRSWHYKAQKMEEAAGALRETDVREYVQLATELVNQARGMFRCSSELWEFVERNSSKGGGD